MEKSEEKIISQTYTKWAKEEKKRSMQVGWSGDFDQTSRFAQFLEFEEYQRFSDSSLLDVGCGYGNFLDFLKQKKIHLKKYVGIDLTKYFIERAKQVDNAKFIYANFLEYKFTEQFDFSIASGIFNVNCSDDKRAYSILYDTLRKMLTLSRIAISFNFLSQRETKNFALTEEMQTFSKSKILKWCKNQNVKEVITFEGYDEFDTTILLVK